MQAYFEERHDLATPDAVLGFLDTDFRCVGVDYTGPDCGVSVFTYSEAAAPRPLANATAVADVEAFEWPRLEWFGPPDFAEARARWPDHALVYVPGWQPLFCGACEAFGMENALMNAYATPKLFEAFVQGQHDFYMQILREHVPKAVGHVDIVWLADDYASGDALLIDPDVWRRLIKPRLAEQVRFIRDHGLPVLFHSCGNARAILPDFIDVGISALEVFQTSARDMDAPSVARQFGGKLAFYGGIDCQNLLTFGTLEQVRAEVQSNIRDFSPHGGYIVANCHHCIANIRGENIEAMCATARESVLIAKK